MVPQYFRGSGGKVKFNQKLLLMPSTCRLGLHIHPGSRVRLQPVLDPTLACHAAGSGKHVYPAVTPLSDYGGGHRQYVTLNIFSCTMGEQSCLSRVLVLSTRRPSCQLILKLFTAISLLSEELELSGRGKIQRRISVQWHGQAQTTTGNDRWKQTKC